MLQRLIDDVKQSTGSALRLTSLAAAAAIALFITLAFLCAAAFVYVLQHYGPVEACLAGAALFLVIADHDSRVGGASLVPIPRFHIPGVILGDGIAPRKDPRIVSQISRHSPSSKPVKLSIKKVLDSVFSESEPSGQVSL